MLAFVGLGLHDERSITLEGQDLLAGADRAFAEVYTSRLAGATVDDVAASHGVEVERLERSDVEQSPEPILAAAEAGTAAFLVAGDPMVSTTHVDLRLRAAERGIDTRIVHGVSAGTAVPGLTGLQNYRFGKAVTLPFAHTHGSASVPESVTESIEGNRERGLHTLVYLDIAVGDRREGAAGSYLTADAAAGLLVDAWADALAVAVARAGSPDPVVVADRLSALADEQFGAPPHALVVPGDLHHVESEALRAFGGAPADLV